MPEYHRVKNMKRALGFLELKDLAEIDWQITTGYKEIIFSHDHDDLDPDVRQRIKGLFPCHKLSDGYNSKDFRGSHKVDDNLTIVIKLTKVLACRDMKPEELAEWTEQDWADYQSLAMEGAVKVVKCGRPNEMGDD